MNDTITFAMTGIKPKEIDSNLFYFEIRGEVEDYTIGDKVLINNVGYFISNRDILTDAINQKIISKRSDELELNQIYKMYNEVIQY